MNGRAGKGAAASLFFDRVADACRPGLLSSRIVAFVH